MRATRWVPALVLLFAVSACGGTPQQGTAPPDDPAQSGAAEEEAPPGEVVVLGTESSLGHVETMVVYSVADGGLTEKARFEIPELSEDGSVYYDDYFDSAALTRSLFTADYSGLVMVRVEGTDMADRSQRVGLLDRDGNFTDLSGVPEGEQVVQNRPAVHRESGRIWYWQSSRDTIGSTLMSMDADGGDRRTETAEHELIGGLRFSFPGPAPVPVGVEREYAVSDDGALAALAEEGAVWVGPPTDPRGGQEYPLPAEIHDFTATHFLDDTTLLGTATPSGELYTFDLETRTATRLTSTEDGAPGAVEVRLSPDRGTIVFSEANTPGPVLNLYTVPVTGGEPRPLLQGPEDGHGQELDLLGWD